MEEQFLRLLARLQNRLRWVVAWQTALGWAWWGCWISLLAAALLKVLDSPTVDLWNAPWIGVVFGLCGFSWGWQTPPSLKRAALLADAKHHLQERLVSVLEQQMSRRPQTSVAQFLLHDGLQAVQGLDPASTFPNLVRRPLAKLLIPLTFMTALIESPSWNLLHGIPESDLQAIRRSGHRIEELAKRLRQQNPHSPKAHRIASRLEQLAHKLGKGNQALDRTLDRHTAALELDETLHQLRRERTLARGAPSCDRKAGAVAEKHGVATSPAPRQSPRSQGDERANPFGDTDKDQEKVDDQVANEAEEGLLAEDQSLEPGGRQHPSGSTHKGEAGPPAGDQQVAKNPAPGSGGSIQKKDGKGGPADFGQGTTNEEQKSSSEREAKAHLERQFDAHPSKQEAFRRIYGAQREHFESAEAKLKGHRGNSRRLLSSHGSGWGQPSVGGRSGVPAEQLFLESRADAEQAMVQGSIPGPYQEVVRNYFQQIDPRTSWEGGGGERDQ